MIKIPATLEGIPAIEETIAAGHQRQRHADLLPRPPREVIEAYLNGLERFVAGGGDPSTIASVASFFVSRVDTETDRRLPEGSPLRGQGRGGERQARLRAVPRAVLGTALGRARGEGRAAAAAAVGVDVDEEPGLLPHAVRRQLIGRDTVNTLAPASIDALQRGDGNQRADTVTEDVDGARQVMADLAAAGVDFDDVTATLEREGVDSFAASFNDAFGTLEKRRAESHFLTGPSVLAWFDRAYRGSVTPKRRRRGRRRRGGGRRARSEARAR